MQLVDEIKFQPGEELIVYSDGPSSEFKNKFITGKLLFLLSDKLKRNAQWKYFATSHGKGVVDGIGGAAKARVCEQIKSRGLGAVVVQNSFDFANVSAKLLKNVKVIHISKDEIESAISTMKPWDFVLEAKGVTSCHVAKCSDSIVKMWHTALDTDEEAAVTLSYDPAPPVFEGSLPTETQRFPVASETKTFGWKEQIIIGDWVLVQYDNTFYPGDVKNKRGDNIQVNVMIPAGKTRWKWPKKEDSIYYERT